MAWTEGRDRRAAEPPSRRRLPDRHRVRSQLGHPRCASPLTRSDSNGSRRRSAPAACSPEAAGSRSRTGGGRRSRRVLVPREVHCGGRPAVPGLRGQLVHELDGAGVLVGGTGDDRADRRSSGSTPAPEVGADDRQGPVVVLADAAGGRHPRARRRSRGSGCSPPRVQAWTLLEVDLVDAGDRYRRRPRRGTGTRRSRSRHVRGSPRGPRSWWRTPCGGVRRSPLPCTAVPWSAAAPFIQASMTVGRSSGLLSKARSWSRKVPPGRRIAAVDARAMCFHRSGSWCSDVAGEDDVDRTHIGQGQESAGADLDVPGCGGTGGGAHRRGDVEGHDLRDRRATALANTPVPQPMSTTTSVRRRPWRRRTSRSAAGS